MRADQCAGRHVARDIGSPARNAIGDAGIRHRIADTPATISSTSTACETQLLLTIGAVDTRMKGLVRDVDEDAELFLLTEQGTDIGNQVARTARIGFYRHRAHIARQLGHNS